MSDISMKLTQLYALSFGLPKDHFMEYVDEHGSALRILNYPERREQVPVAPAPAAARESILLLDEAAPAQEDDEPGLVSANAGTAWTTKPPSPRSPEGAPVQAAAASAEGASPILTELPELPDSAASQVVDPAARSPPQVDQPGLLGVDPSQVASNVRMTPHSDWGVFTILKQGDVNGLQVLVEEDPEDETRVRGVSDSDPRVTREVKWEQLGEAMVVDVIQGDPWYSRGRRGGGGGPSTERAGGSPPEVDQREPAETDQRGGRP